MRIALVIGGARAGKSAIAERLAAEAAGGGPVVYVATCVPGDDDLRARVAAHRARRPASWTTVEAPDDPAAAVASADGARAVLLDCLSMYVFHALGRGEADDAILAGVRRVARAARGRGLALVAVSTDVSGALVPPDAESRRYQDVLGRANQAFAAEADEVYLAVAGLPLRVK